MCEGCRGEEVREEVTVGVADVPQQSTHSTPLDNRKEESCTSLLDPMGLSLRTRVAMYMYIQW